ncbi:putative transport protein [Fibrella aestuarina BUZ 2]|uniref:Putative transport protein n=1 Tax=Fibrella aestuarina BUZ 2 TaxID=1166018 RepID=I0KA77_9BACT|nr:TolB family protein [Fibrella aestuarina]CCH01030.1 putative transport protein [Fibrella aestuarina BUZ 2]
MRHLYCLFALMPWASSAPQPVISQLETFDLATNQRTVIRRDTGRFEAPNWTKDGTSLIINEQGGLYRVAVRGGQKTRIPTGNITNSNNDHGLSPDGKLLAISNNDLLPGSNSRSSRVYVVPIGGGTPRLVTEQAPSYWHGWSPDGRTLAYVAQRAQGDGSFDFDIYTIPVNGGPETRLTTAKGLDDGPDYAPDGQTIYFNSMRSGKMDIWQMNPNGQNARQLTNDAFSNWFPHPSPDGRWLVFISYLVDQGSNHPADKAVMLRLMDLKTGKLRELARFRGGQGTLNVPSWSPDSRRFAFVSYPEN